MTAQPSPNSTAVGAANLTRLLLLAAGGLLLFLFGVYLVYTANLMRFPFDYDQGEGFELIDTILFSQGRFPYQNIDIYPFFSSNYPPLFHVIAAPFVTLFGPAYWYGRLLGFVSSLAAAGAIGFAVFRGGRQRGVALLAALAFIASNTIYHIGPLFRQHMMMVMFETIAIIVLAGVNEAPRTRRRWLLLCGLLLLLAAGYTKQLAAATCIAAFAFLFIRRPLTALVWGVVFGLMAGGVFIYLNAATNGEWWRNVIAANINRYSLDQTVGLYRLWFSLHGFLILPAALYALYEVYFDRLSIYSVWFVTTAAVGLASGQWGAGDSYFSTAIAAVCILSGLFISRTLNRSWRFEPNYITRAFQRARALISFRMRPSHDPVVRIGGYLMALTPVLYLLYGVAVFHMPTDGPIFADIARALRISPNTGFAFYDSAGRIPGGYADIGHLTSQEDIDAGWRIVEIVRSADGDVMSEDAGFSLLAGRQPVGNPTQLLNLWMNNMLDSSALIAMIEAQSFGVIIFRGQLYPIDVLQAVAAHYAPDITIAMNGFDYIIMRPK
jgi:hypothetical protein